MNVKAVVAALQPLEGNHILILTDTQAHNPVHSQPCLRVQDLPPDQRQPGQGNIILWDGSFTQEGLQAGVTFWAKDVRSITWRYNPIAHIHTRQGARVSIIRLWKLSQPKQKGDQSK